jgi:hypothetical protein
LAETLDDFQIRDHREQFVELPLQLGYPMLGVVVKADQTSRRGHRKKTAPAKR